jgi:hypothetical protein
VPSELIHDWIGAAFIPNATIDEVLSVCRDYEHYKDFYRPRESIQKPISGMDQPFIARASRNRPASKTDSPCSLMNRALFLKTTLDGEFEASYFHVDDHRWYSITRTTHMQEHPRRRESASAQCCATYSRLEDLPALFLQTLNRPCS